MAKQETDDIVQLDDLPAAALSSVNLAAPVPTSAGADPAGRVRLGIRGPMNSFRLPGGLHHVYARELRRHYGLK
jgi:hypothetical protein